MAGQPWLGAGERLWQLTGEKKRESERAQGGNVGLREEK